MTYIADPSDFEIQVEQVLADLEMLVTDMDAAEAAPDWALVREVLAHLLAGVLSALGRDYLAAAGHAVAVLEALARLAPEVVERLKLVDVTNGRAFGLVLEEPVGPEPPAGPPVSTGGKP